MTRKPHWIRENRQERIPPRMVSFDTESRSHRNGDHETQTWRTACAIRWRTDLKTGDHAEASVFSSDVAMWEWIADYCRPGTRTVAWAHNLGHDVRISSALTILPKLGFTLEWCNLDQNVSCMTWRSGRGTLVLADTWTWLPVSINAIGPDVGLGKLQMPGENADDETWNAYCMRDAQVVYRIASDLVGFVRSHHLGNWQPTGAGMAYATWRHRFMRHKILVHADTSALQAERAAMHTGRAEAWRHGRISGVKWTEVDMSNAYLTIGAECELPRKLRFSTGKITIAQYRRLAASNRVLCKCRITADTPVVPARINGREMWPEGTFDTWIWDTEVDAAIRYGCAVSVLQSYVYARAPILQDWAKWVLGKLQGNEQCTSPVARTYLKHSARALVGRIALKTGRWEVFGSNPEHLTGITRLVDPETRQVWRLMHVGDLTMIEAGKDESENSIPMVTSWIMSECRVRLWDAMNIAGLDHIAHVDTDSILADSDGLARLRKGLSIGPGCPWHVKGTWATIDVWGPRRYVRGQQRVMAGIPVRAEEIAPGTYRGEKWASTATDLETREDGIVTTRRETWTMKRSDPRRRDATGTGGRTASYVVAVSGASIESSSPRSTAGE